MKSIYKIISITILVLLSQTTSAEKCRALVIEGGGDLGAYEAGVIKGLIENLPVGEAQWDVLSGISVGSILSVGFSQFAKGDELAASDWIISMWEQISKDKVYKNWSPGGLLQGLLFEKGIFNTKPLKEYLTSHITQSLKRKINIGATDVNNGNLIRYTESLPMDQLITAVLSSSAVPMVFPYQSLHDYTFFDGGVAHMMDVPGAVNRCREIATDDKDIIVDVLMIAAKKLEPWPPNPDENPFNCYQRFSALRSYEKTYREYLEARENYPDVTYRYFIHPSQPLPDASFPFFFNHNQLMDMIQIGIQDAINVINQGEGVSAKKALKEAYEVVLSRNKEITGVEHPKLKELRELQQAKHITKDIEVLEL